MSYQRGRAYHRHQDTRAKHRARIFLKKWGYAELNAKVIGCMASVHCKPCSNPWCCGNARAISGDTWQEIDAALSEKEQRFEL